MKSRDARSQSRNDLDQFAAIEQLFESDPIDLIEKIEAFPKYVSRQSMAKFLTKYEIFKRILHVNGSIVECGVLHGAGLMAWAKLSSIFEPVNHTRRVIGFDSFEGFPNVTPEDTQTGTASSLHKGGLAGSPFDHVRRAVEVFDINRMVGHIPKVELVKGDICTTAATYVADHPHLVVSLLYLDVDLYEPTRAALEVFIPRMPKGAIVAFDELNAQIFPGETQAVLETLGLRTIQVQRFSFDSYVSFAVI